MKWKNYVTVIKHSFLIECQKILNHAHLVQFIPGIFQREGIRDGKRIVETICITRESDITDMFKIVHSISFRDEKESDHDKPVEKWVAVREELTLFLTDGNAKRICFFVPEKKLLIMNNCEFIKQ